MSNYYGDPSRGHYGPGGGGDHYGPPRGGGDRGHHGDGGGGRGPYGPPNRRGGHGGRPYDERHGHGDRRVHNNGHGHQGRGGRGGGRDRHDDEQMRRALEQHGLDVSVNCFNIVPLKAKEMTWYRYFVEVARREPVRDPDTKQVQRDSDGRKVYKYTVLHGRSDKEPNPLDPDGEPGLISSLFTRKVLDIFRAKAEELDDSVRVITNGSSMLFSSKHIFDHPEELPEEASAMGPAGVYGPEDAGAWNQQQGRILLPSFHQDIRLEPGDETSNVRVNTRWFRVKLLYVGRIPFQVVEDESAKLLHFNQEHKETLEQCLNIALKNIMMRSSMLTLENSSAKFFFPLEKQGAFLGRALSSIQSDSFQPLVGLLAKAHISATRRILLTAGSAIDWVRPEASGSRSHERSEPPGPVMVLTPKHGVSGMIAGVHVDNLHQPITDEKVREEIVQALRSQGSFKVRYNCGPKWVENQKTKENPRDAAWIKKNQKRRFPARRLCVAKKPGHSPLKWGCDDPSVYSFKPTCPLPDSDDPEQKVTVHEYYAKRYDVHLKYPKMPLVEFESNNGPGELFPIEFLAQATTKVRNINSLNPQATTQVLAFHDEHQGRRRLDHTTMMLNEEEFRKECTNVLNSLNLGLDTRPVTMRAAVLECPDLRFRDDDRTIRSWDRNGWNLLGRRFWSAAPLNSFAVICMSSELNRMHDSEMVQKVLKALARHGDGEPVPPERLNIRDVLYVVNQDDPGSWTQAFEQASRLAQDRFRKEAEILFVIVRDKDSVRYNLVKFLSYMVSGVQSQVMVSTNFNKRQDQYASNVALKVNAKLSTPVVKARAWQLVDASASSDLPWLADRPALVFGVASSSEHGKDGCMVVVGTALLDEGGMRCCHEMVAQKKSPIYSEETLTEIVKSLLYQFRDSTGHDPAAVVMYRLGGHDGQFEELEAKEASVVSKFTERELSRFVPLTYVVAQTDVDLRFIPAVSGGQHQGLPNVPTGTLVTDSRIIGGERSFGRQDFYIVPQQGLKGTSKPVYYRCLRNENYRADDTSSLTPEKLQKLTYAMSFAYASATKATRLPPVLQYSYKNANTAIGFLVPYLWGDRRPADGTCILKLLHQKYHWHIGA